MASVASSTIPHPIPYQGSKRGLAAAILEYFPAKVERLIEPFAGSAAISLAAAHFGKAAHFILNDINEPLMWLWQAIMDEPARLADCYRRMWHEQLGNERAYYDAIRAKFNATREPEYLLYLLARCVKAAVRYNANGDFNQSPDNRRQGAKPSTLKFHINGAAALLRGKTALQSQDYRQVLELATPGDLIYMDPPYQGVCGRRDQRYVEKLSYEHFVSSLELLNDRGISYIVSYDGRTGSKVHGKPLPASLRLRQIELRAGRSSQATLLGRGDCTFESLYLSPALTSRLELR
jgi:DNA adenine methylase